MFKNLFNIDLLSNPDKGLEEYINLELRNI